MDLNGVAIKATIVASFIALILSGIEDAKNMFSPEWAFFSVPV